MTKELTQQDWFHKLTELHTHLGSATTMHSLWEIAHRRGVVLTQKDYWKFINLTNYEAGEDRWKAYHHYFDVVQEIQSSPEAIELSVMEAVSLAYRKGGVTQLELRFNPMRRNNNKQYDLDWVILSALMGMKKSMMMYPIKVGLILEMDRRFSVKQNAIIVRKAIKHKNEGILGIDVSGPNDENFHMKDILPLVQEAKKAGLKVTAHTGEATGADEVEFVVDNFEPERIGHGIKCVDNPSLMKKIAEKGIILEVCPSSNVTLEIVKDWDEMKQIIRTLLDNKVKFCINSDGPVFLHSNTQKEYLNLFERGIMSIEELKQSNEIAREGSFIA